MRSEFVAATAAGSPFFSYTVFTSVDGYHHRLQNIWEMTHVIYTFNIPQRSCLWIWLAWLKYDGCDIERLGLYWIFNLSVDFGFRDVPFLLISVVGAGARELFGASLRWISTVKRDKSRAHFKVNNTEPHGGVITGKYKRLLRRLQELFFFTQVRLVDPEWMSV